MNDRLRFVLTVCGGATFLYSTIGFIIGIVIGTMAGPRGMGPLKFGWIFGGGMGLFGMFLSVLPALVLRPGDWKNALLILVPGLLIGWAPILNMLT